MLEFRGNVSEEAWTYTTDPLPTENSEWKVLCETREMAIEEAAEDETIEPGDEFNLVKVKASPVQFEVDVDSIVEDMSLQLDREQFDTDDISRWFDGISKEETARLKTALQDTLNRWVHAEGLKVCRYIPLSVQRTKQEFEDEDEYNGKDAVDAMNYISTYCCSKRTCEDNCVFHSQRYGCLLKEHPTQWSMREEEEEKWTE